MPLNISLLKIKIGLDKNISLVYIKCVLKNAKQNQAPTKADSAVFFVILADTEYHSCNRFVNSSFGCGLQNLTRSEVKISSHFILPQREYDKQDFERTKGRKNERFYKV